MLRAYAERCRVSPPELRRRCETTGSDPVVSDREQGADAAALEPAGDDQPLDLAGALPDAVDSQLAEEPLGYVRPHVAPAAERLHAAVGAAPCGLAREELRHAGVGVHELPVD